MEREKTIEQMKSCADSAYYNWDNAPKDPIWRICEGLYDADYRKVPEGAVVLTKEELEKMDNRKNYGDVVDTLFFRIRVLKREHENRLEQIRKDTAREIIRKVGTENLLEKGKLFGDLTEQEKSVLKVYSDRLGGFLRDLAKQYGVEV